MKKRLFLAVCLTLALILMGGMTVSASSPWMRVKYMRVLVDAIIGGDLSIDDDLTLGDGSEEDVSITFDGNAQDFYLALDDSADDFLIGLGSTVGTTGIIHLDESQLVGLGAASAGAKLDVTGNVMVDGDTDEVQLTVQGHSAQNGGIFVVETSAGTDKFLIDATGWVTQAGILNLDGNLDMDATTADMELLGAFSIDADLASNITLSAQDLTIEAETGSINIKGDEAAADAVSIDANDAAGTGLTIATGATGGMNVSGGTVTIATDTIVDGATDTVQLTVQGATPQQNGGLFVVENSGGTDKFTVDATGWVTVANNLVVGGTSDLQGNVSDSGGVVTFADNVIVDGQADAVQLTVQGATPQQNGGVFVVENSGGTDQFTVDAAGWITTTGPALFGGDVELNGTTPALTIGDAGEEDTSVIFDGAAQDFYVGLYDTDDDLQIGLGSALGTTPIIVLDESQNVGLGAASAAAKLDVTGNVMIDGDTDEAQLTVQGHSAQNGGVLIVENSSGTDALVVNANGWMTVTSNAVVGGTSDLQGNVADSGGALTIDDNVLVDGQTDTVQLTVQGATPQQNGGVFVVESSGGTDAFVVDANGWVTTTSNLVVGGTADVSGDITLENDETIGNATDGEILATGNLSVTGQLTVATSLVVVGELYDAVYSIAAESANDLITVTVQLNDGAGNAMATRSGCMWYLADDAAGDTICAGAPSAGIAIGTDGLLIEWTADISGWVVSESDGDIDIIFGDNGADTFYLVLVMPDGSLDVSTVIEFAA